MDLRIKFMFVGQENVGKSSLVSGLKTYQEFGNKKYKKEIGDNGGLNQATTEGIKISDFVYKSEGFLGGKSVRVKMWDFAGSEVFQTTHAFFLTERSIYFLVWNINAEPLNSRIPHWLKTIKFHAPNSPIILVSTRLDTCKKKKERIDQVTEDVLMEYKPDFPQIRKIYPVSISTGEGMKELIAGIDEVLAELSYLKSPPISHFINFGKAVILARPQEKKEPPLLEWKSVQKFAEKNHVPNYEIVKAVGYLQDIGEVVYCPGKENENNSDEVQKKSENFGFVILDPQWICDMFATIISRQNDYVKSGILELSTLKSKMWSNIPSNLHDQLLRVLEAFEIVFKIPGDAKILIPGLLDFSLPNFQSKWPAHNPNTIQFTRLYDFPFVPSGLFSRFLVRLGQLPHQKKYWATGMFIESDEALSLIEFIASDNRISVSTRGQGDRNNPVVLFATVVELLDALLENQFKVKAKILLPCPSCVASQVQKPTLFTKEECESIAAKKEMTVRCEMEPDDPHNIPMYLIAPDIAMVDFDSRKINVQSDCEISEKIGEGSFATVSKGILKKEKRVVAIKTLKISDQEKSAEAVKVLNEFRREVRVMSRFNHPNLVELVGFSLEPPFSMAMEFLACGDLFSLLHEKKDQKITSTYSIRIAFDVSRGLQFLHSLDPPLLHRDLKTPNVMLASSDARAPVVAKIADFGLTKELLTETLRGETASNREVTNPTWLAPEVLAAKNYGKPSDVYAFGLILWELITQEIPYRNFEFDIEKEKAIIDGTRPKIPANCSDNMRHIIESCWDPEPDKRPSMETVAEELIPGLIKNEERDLMPIIKQIMESHSNTSSLRKSSISIRPPGGNQRSRSAMIQKRMSRKIHGNVEEIVVKGANAEELGFKKKTSTSLINRWKPNSLVKTVVKTQQIRRQILRPLSDKIYWCPFPDELPSEDWADLSLELEEKYAGFFKIYNLSGQKYDYTLYNGIVAEYPLNMDEPPPLSLLKACAQDMVEWLDSNSENIVILHCIGIPPSRAAIISAASLTAMKKSNVNESIENFCHKIHKEAIPTPSQLRYLRYFERMALQGVSASPPKFYLHKLRFNSIPNFKITGGCDPYYSIFQGGKKVFFSKKLKGRKETSSVEFFCRDILVQGDIRIEFYHKSYEHQMFTISLNTNFEEIPKDGKLTFSKNELDKANKDTKKQFPSGFIFEVYFLSQAQKQQVSGGGTQDTGKIKLFEKCGVCHKLMKEDEMTMEILVGYTVHLDCMACSKCGISLKDGTVSSLVKGGEIICTRCDTEFFPECHKCKDRIRGQVISRDDLSWHPEHLTCSRCDKLLSPQEFLLKNNMVFCEGCSTVVKAEPKKVTRPKIPELEELESLLKEELGLEFFRKYAELQNFLNLLLFYLIVQERKQVSKKRRKEMAVEIEHQFFSSSSSSTTTTPLPSSLISQIKPISDSSDYTSAGLFDEAVGVVFYEMASAHFGAFVNSPFYEEFVKALRVAPDPEEEQEALRREAAAIFIPINKEDILPESQEAIANTKKKEEEEKKKKEEKKEKRKKVKKAIGDVFKIMEQLKENSVKIKGFCDVAMKNHENLVEGQKQGERAEVLKEFMDVEASEFQKVSEIVSQTSEMKNSAKKSFDEITEATQRPDQKEIVADLLEDLNTAYADLDNLSGQILESGTRSAEILKEAQKIFNEVTENQLKSEKIGGLLEFVAENTKKEKQKTADSLQNVKILRKKMAEEALTVDSTNQIFNEISQIIQNFRDFFVTIKNSAENAIDSVNDNGTVSNKDEAEKMKKLMKEINSDILEITEMGTEIETENEVAKKYTEAMTEVSTHFGKLLADVKEIYLESESLHEKIIEAQEKVESGTDEAEIPKDIEFTETSVDELLVLFQRVEKMTEVATTSLQQLKQKHTTHFHPHQANKYCTQIQNFHDKISQFCSDAEQALNVARLAGEMLKQAQELREISGKVRSALKVAQDARYFSQNVKQLLAEAKKSSKNRDVAQLEEQLTQALKVTQTAQLEVSEALKIAQDSNISVNSDRESEFLSKIKDLASEAEAEISKSTIIVKEGEIVIKQIKEEEQVAVAMKKAKAIAESAKKALAIAENARKATENARIAAENAKSSVEAEVSAKDAAREAEEAAVVAENAAASAAEAARILEEEEGERQAEKLKRKQEGKEEEEVPSGLRRATSGLAAVVSNEKLIQKVRKVVDKAKAAAAAARAAADEAMKEAEKAKEVVVILVKKEKSLLTSCLICCKEYNTETEKLVKRGPYTLHESCFACIKCKKTLDGLQFAIVDDQFWCMDDFVNQKAVKCSVCTQAIFSDNCLHAPGHYFHLTCLKCCLCKRNCGNMEFFLNENLVYCGGCMNDKERLGL